MNHSLLQLAQINWMFLIIPPFDYHHLQLPLGSRQQLNFPDEGVMVNKGGLGSESSGANQNYGIWFTPSERLQGGFETTGGTNRYITSANAYNDGQWHHGVVTFDNPNNIVRLFVDGRQIGTLSTTSNPDNTGSQPLRIAGNAQSLTEDFFIGQLDEVDVWNRVSY